MIKEITLLYIIIIFFNFATLIILTTRKCFFLKTTTLFVNITTVMRTVLDCKSATSQLVVVMAYARLYCEVTLSASDYDIEHFLGRLNH